MLPSNQIVSAFKPWKTARLIFKVGIKVEVSFEEEVFRDVWFPATVVEDLGNNLFLVEYKGSGINNETELRRVTVDHLHIRPLSPQIRVTNFGLLEKVDALYNFGWWSGVITKKLADNRYVVYFKHTNKVKELSHLELRPHLEWKDDKWFTPYQVPVSDDADNVDNGESRENVSLNLANPIVDTTTGIDKQTFSETTSMKRSKPTSVGSSDKHIKPSKKTKTGVTSDDLSPSNGRQSKDVSNPPADQSKHGPKVDTGDQTFGIIANLSRGKKKIGRQEKGVALKQLVITPARRKRRLSANNRAPEALPQGDSTTNTTPTTGEEKHVTKYFPLPIVLGLQCNAMRDSRSKISKQLPSKSPSNTAEPKTPQSTVPLTPKTTGNLEKEAGGDTNVKRKRGRPFKNQTKTPETSMAVIAVDNQDGDAIAVANVDEVRSRSGGIALALQQEKFTKPTKGKRGKRRTISSLNTESSLKVPAFSEAFQNSSTQKANGNIETVERSVDTVSDDQPLSMWFEANHSLAALNSTAKKPTENPPVEASGDGPTLTFEKRSSLWERIESMEAFRSTPQNPHFHPLNSLKENARERQAITLMVNFSGVFEDTFRLQVNSPRTEIQDLLETLSELETHGFNVDVLRNRLMGLLSVKHQQEKLQTRSTEVLERINKGSVEGEKFGQELEGIDKQFKELHDKRVKVVEMKEKLDTTVAALKVEFEIIREQMHENCRSFNDLVSAPL